MRQGTQSGGNSVAIQEYKPGTTAVPTQTLTWRDASLHGHGFQIEFDDT